ncbi:MAG: thioredoxin domain-containing protein [Myxococcota bacterium]|nr:thioredoxin domain-containing protein [Myxococcota bacterium]
MYTQVVFVTAALALGTPVLAQDCPASPSQSPSAVVATLTGGQVTLAEVDKELGGALCQAKMNYDMKVAELRQQALSNLIDKRLLDKEVKRLKKNTIDALISSEVIEKLKAPTESEIKAFYDANRDQIGEQKLDEIRDQIRNHLAQEKQQTAIGAYVTNLKKNNQVKTLLAPYRVPVKATGPSRGPANAKVTIIEFADFECAYCGRAGEVMKAVIKKYPKDVRVVFRDFPLDFHPNAVPAAVAARCAGQQGKYWQMHDTLFENMHSLGADALRGYAKTIGLDLKKFDVCIADPKMPAAVRADQADAAQFGVEGTPAFFVNGIPVSGAQPLEVFAEIIDRELSR